MLQMLQINEYDDDDDDHVVRSRPGRPIK